LPDRLMGDHDAPFQHHLLDLAEAEREPVVEPDSRVGSWRVDMDRR
jgi:hypothetical protein